MPLTIIGLGPGPAELLTFAAHRTLSEAQEVYLRTARHPTVAELPGRLDVHSFDHLYGTLPSFAEVYNAIIQQVWDLAQRPQGVLYAVPGHPLIAEATVTGLLERCHATGTPVKVLDGLSFLEPALTALRLDPFSAREAAAPGLQLVDALQPAVDPSHGALVAQLYSRDVAAQLKVELLELYPAEHQITIVVNAGCADERVRTLPLYELDREDVFNHLTCLYLPPLALTANTATVAGLAAIVARLRAPNGCPWDREQTHTSLKPYLLEETYEAIDALDKQDMDGVREELGDVLLNILLHCQMASEEEQFQLRDVVRGISEKIIRRHPHVFGDLHLASAQQVAQNWEALKEKERPEEQSMLEGLPRSLPALAYTRSLQERLAQLQLPDSDIAADVASILAELEGKGTDEAHLALGERLRELAYRAAAAGLNPEEALRRANDRLSQQVRRVEGLARQQGYTLQAIDPATRKQLWAEATVAP